METTTNWSKSEISRKEYPNDRELEFWWGKHSQQAAQVMSSLYNFSGKRTLREIHKLSRIDDIATRTEASKIFNQKLKESKLRYSILEARDDMDSVVYFGILFGKSVYHWFEVDQYGNMPYVNCTHSYSQNTGNTEKGLRWRMNVERNLAKKLGVEFLNDIFKSITTI